MINKIIEYRGFIYTNEQYHFASNLDCLDEIIFGIFCKDEHGNDQVCKFQMSFNWYEIFDRRHPRLEVFDDVWLYMRDFDDLWDELAKHNDKSITPKEMMEVLKKMGFQDITNRVKPK